MPLKWSLKSSLITYSTPAQYFLYNRFEYFKFEKFKFQAKHLKYKISDYTTEKLTKKYSTAQLLFQTKLELFPTSCSFRFWLPASSFNLGCNFRQTFICFDHKLVTILFVLCSFVIYSIPLH